MSFISSYATCFQRISAKATAAGLALILLGQSAGALTNAVAKTIDDAEIHKRQTGGTITLTRDEMAELLGWQTESAAVDYSAVDFRMNSAAVYTDASMTERMDGVYIAVTGRMPYGCEVVAYPAAVPDIGGEVITAYTIRISDHYGEEVLPQDGEMFNACINDPAIADYFAERQGDARVVKVNGSDGTESIVTGFDGMVVGYNVRGSGVYAVLYSSVVSNATNTYNNSATTTFRVKWTWEEGETPQTVTLNVCADGEEITNTSSGDFSGKRL